MVIKIFKKIVATSVLILMCISFFFTSTVKAGSKVNTPDTSGKISNVEVTLDSSRDKIASWAESFASDNSMRCKYDVNKRGKTYLGRLPNSSDPYYYFDCVGFASFVINRAIGLDYAGAHVGFNEGGSGFVTPQSGVRDTLHFAQVPVSSARRGDILIAPGAPHVAIYLGNGRVADMWESGLSIRNIDSSYRMTSWSKCVFTSSATLISVDGVHFGDLPGGIDIGNIPEGTLTATEVNLDDINFKYSGMPSEVIDGESYSPMFYVNKIGEAIDYIVGIMFNGIKVVTTGIAEGLEGFLTDIFKSLSGEQDIAKVNLIDSNAYYLQKKQVKSANKHYTIEDVIFNKIPILDVNVFSKTAGGQEVLEDSAVYKIRQAVATWYVSFRNLVTLALSVIIIYIGIKMATSTVAQKKADYKRMIIGWLTAILIVYTIHYAMMIVLNVNGELVSIFSHEAQSEISMYETIRTRKEEINFSVGLPAAIMYIVLVIYFFMFSWVYIKRYLTVLLLIILAPVVGAKYALDSVSKGKKGKVFSKWMYEFVMNVLLQSVHALIYTVIMKIAIELATTSILGYVVALVFMNFILKADKIFMHVFNFGRSKTAMASVESMENPKKDFASGLFILGATKEFAQGVWDMAGWAEGKASKGIKTLAKKYDKKHDTDIEGDFKKIKNKGLDMYDTLINEAYKKVTGHDSNYRVLSIMSRKKDSTGKSAKKQFKKAKKNRNAKFTAPFKFILSSSGNVLKVAIGVPMTVVNPGVGFGMVVSGGTGLSDMATKPDNKGNKYKGAEAVAQAGTLGAYGTVKEIRKNDKKIGKAVNYLKQARKTEAEIEKLFTNIFGEELNKDAKKYKSEISYMLKYGDKDNVHGILRERLNRRNIFTIDDANVDDTIDKLADDVFNSIDIGGQYTKARAENIRKQMKERAKEIYNNQKTELDSTYGASDIAQGFSEAIYEGAITRKESTKELTNKFIELHETNKKAQEDIKTSVVKESQFIKSLNRRKGSTDSENQ